MDLDIDPECIMTFEKNTAELVRLETILAGRLGLNPVTARLDLMALDKANKLVEDEVVADWHSSYAWYVSFLRDDYSPVAMFHLGLWDTVDHKGRTRDQILSWSNTQLERSHDYVQWFFPTERRSEFNPLAPVLTPKDIEHFRGSKELQHSILMCLERMQVFFEATRPWEKPRDHNLLRMTRILDCLLTVGLKDEALAFYSFLTGKAAEPLSRVPENTLEIWRSVVVDHGGITP